MNGKTKFGRIEVQHSIRIEKIETYEKHFIIKNPLSEQVNENKLEYR